MPEKLTEMMSNNSYEKMQMELMFSMRKKEMLICFLIRESILIFFGFETYTDE